MTAACEPTLRVRRRDRPRRHADGIQRRLGRPRLQRSRDPLDLRPRRLDRVRVRRGRRRVTRARAGRRERRDPARGLVGRRDVPHPDVPRAGIRRDSPPRTPASPTRRSPLVDRRRDRPVASRPGAARRPRHRGRVVLPRRGMIHHPRIPRGAAGPPGPGRPPPSPRPTPAAGRGPRGRVAPGPAGTGDSRGPQPRDGPPDGRQAALPSEPIAAHAPGRVASGPSAIAARRSSAAAPWIRGARPEGRVRARSGRFGPRARSVSGSAAMGRGIVGRSAPGSLRRRPRPRPAAAGRSSTPPRAVSYSRDEPTIRDTPRTLHYSIHNDRNKGK